MRKQDARFDYDRYRKLLAEAVDEKKRLALIDLLVEERAKDQLELQQAADRNAMTVATIAKVLGSSRS
ncbi:MAG: hypothetical protein JWP25_6653 [Bradyrhizobium sp.]|jgi:hypothetical protein|nr:hypothetical protein [Bradyrhizobium sp.]